MIAHMEMQLDGFCTVLVIVGLRETTSFYHLSKYHITTLTATFWISYRIIVRRILTEAYQGSCFINRQILRFLTEIRIRCRLDTDRIMKEVKIIQIHSNNLILRIIAFQLDGNYPLDRLLQHTFHCGLGMF